MFGQNNPIIEQKKKIKGLLMAYRSGSSNVFFTHVYIFYALGNMTTVKQISGCRSKQYYIFTSSTLFKTQTGMTGSGTFNFEKIPCTKDRGNLNQCRHKKSNTSIIIRISNNKKIQNKQVLKTNAFHHIDSSYSEPVEYVVLI